MNVNSVLGQYYAADSAVHRLDPRVKLLGALVYMTALFSASRWWGLSASAAALAGLFKVARIPPAFAARSLKSVWPLLLFSFLLRALCEPGETSMAVFLAGAEQGLRFALRIGLMVAGASLLSCTATPRQLADGLEAGCSFMERWRVPVRDMAVIAMIAFRFIPLMAEEMRIRGGEFEGCPVWKKCRAAASLTPPLFFASLRRAADLAEAMDARGYCEERAMTRLYPLRYTAADRHAYVCIAAYGSAMLTLSLIL